VGAWQSQAGANSPRLRHPPGGASNETLPTSSSIKDARVSGEVNGRKVSPYARRDLNSRVEFVLDNKDTHTLSLIAPDEADVDRGMVPVLIPIGAAFIGLRPGQMMMRSYEGNLH
jgi:transcription elongation GreA/GreB family factor